MNHVIIRRALWAAGGLLFIGAAVGCGGMPEDDSTVQDGLAAADDGACGTAADAGRGRDHAFHRRCQHYRHRHHYKHGNGGGTQLAVRALMDASLATELEVTTGQFDDGSTPAGAIQRVEVTMIQPGGHHRTQLELRPQNPSVYFAAPLPRAIHGQDFTVDATVAAGRRTDRVSVDDQVHYRPDLAVRALTVPASASAGASTSIAATIAELMGDLGGRADCVLSVDGAVADSVRGIWVDSGGAVTCHFTYAFPAPGAHTVHVDVANVTPRDYDPRNNGADATVVVMPQFGFTASAFDATYGGADRDQVVDGAGNALYDQSSTWGGSLQSVSINGSWPSKAVFPLAALSANATSAGTSWPVVSATNVTATSSDPVQGDCASQSDPNGFDWITVCAAADGNGGGATTVNVSTFAGDVTYHSEGVCRQATSYTDCSNGFTWNTDTSSQWSTRHPFGDSVAMDLSLTDAAGLVLAASPVIPLAAYQSQYDVPLTCDAQPDGTQHCYSHQYLETGMRGSVGM